MRNKHKDSQDLAKKDSKRLHWIIRNSYARDQNLMLWISMVELDQPEERISFTGWTPLTLRQSRFIRALTPFTLEQTNMTLKQNQGKI